MTGINVTGNVYVSNAVTATTLYGNVSASNVVVTPATGVTGITVTGNIYASNAVTATNLFANTLTMSNTSSSITVTGNIYASNAITTTNLTCAGFTSNVSNTIFNFSTLTIPFVYCTTLNTASTANVLTLSVPGSFGQTSVAVTGNVYASNAVTTTNLFANNGLDVGPGILGSNVVIFSNVSGGSNVFVMDSNGRVTIGSLTQPGGSLLSFGQTTLNKIITLWDAASGDNPSSATNFYGFGVNSLVLRYQVSSGNGNHIFYGGSSEYARITSAGVGILTGAAPTSNLQVAGNVYASNAITTTNLFANTMTLSNASAVITGNLYVSNAVTTTNLTCAGFTSNVSNTIFNFDTFTIPFIQCTTLNVASTSNVLTLTIPGTIGQTSLTVGGNVFANTATLVGTTGQTTLAVTGNVYASNALSTTNVFASSVIPTYPLSFRNRIINGDFIIDQRNAGASLTPGAGKSQLVDRWKVEIAGSGRCLVGQNLGSIASPASLTSYFGMRVSTTTTPGVGDYFFMSQIIEGINTVDLVWGQATAKPATLSFWVYSSLTGTGGGFIRNAGESAGNYNRSYPFTYTINATNTWEYKTVAITGDTTGQWLSGQLDGVEVGFIMWNGTSFQGTAGAWAAANYTGPSAANINYAGTLNSNLYVTGIQFEAGPFATPFERRHMGFELAQCQRYYEPTIARLGGYHTAGGALRSSVYFNVKKRPKVTPTFTVISAVEGPTNMGSLTFDSSNFDQSSARIYAPVTATGDGYGQWKVSVDCEFLP